MITPAEQTSLQAALAADPSPVGPGGASSITNQPPLYYALAAIPYWLSPSNDILDRLEFMRLFSALLAGLTVLATFLFVRELFPALRWALDRRLAGRRLPAAVRLHLGRRPGRQPAVLRVGRHLPRPDPCLPPRADAPPGSLDRLGERDRPARQADLRRVRSRDRRLSGADRLACGPRRRRRAPGSPRTRLSGRARGS